MLAALFSVKVKICCFVSLTHWESTCVISAFFFMSVVFPPLIKPKPLRVSPKMLGDLHLHNGQNFNPSIDPGSNHKLHWSDNAKGASGEPNGGVSCLSYNLPPRGPTPMPMMRQITQPVTNWISRGPMPLVNTIIQTSTVGASSSTCITPTFNLAQGNRFFCYPMSTSSSYSSYRMSSSHLLPIIPQVVHAMSDHTSTSSNTKPFQTLPPFPYHVFVNSPLNYFPHQKDHVLTYQYHPTSTSDNGIDDDTYAQDLNLLRERGVLPQTSSDDEASWIAEVVKSSFADLYPALITSHNHNSSTLTNRVNDSFLPCSDSLLNNVATHIFDKVTDTLSPTDFALSNATSLLGECQDVDFISPSLFLSDVTFNAYKNSSEVAQDVVSSVSEQRKSVFDDAVTKVVDDISSDAQTVTQTSHNEVTKKILSNGISMALPLTSSEFCSSESRSLSSQGADILEPCINGKIISKRKEEQIKTRGRRSFDHELIKLYSLPVVAEDLINMTQRQVKVLIDGSPLTSTQRNVLKKIRRRGRNRIAARRCRERHFG